VATGFDAYDGSTSLVTAFDGADVAVLVTPHAGPVQFGDDAMLQERMICAATEAGVKHIVNIGSWTVNAAKPLSLLSGRFTGVWLTFYSKIKRSRGCPWSYGVLLDWLTTSGFVTFAKLNTLNA
jgi:hypothetical protein